MFAELAALLFMSRDFGHKAHLRTRSYAQHIALKEFYEALTDNIDTLVEAYQGRCGIIDIPECIPESPLSEPALALRKHLQIIEEVRAKAIPATDTPLNSLLDEVCTVYLSTIFKLERLS